MVKARRVGWWGKLPARGDFVGRGLPPRWRAEWDDWLQRGLALAAAAADDAVLRERLDGFAPWRYLALAAPREAWCGIVVASHDRVGRAFPLTLAERLPWPAAAAMGLACAARLAALLDAARVGPEALEAAILALPPRLDAAPTAGEARAWPATPCSLWWPLNAGPQAQPVVSGWPPAPALLLELLDLHPSAPHQTASAE